jgi:cytochrome c oxidase subunit I+III
VNHRIIGKRYIVTAFIFFLLAGLQALLIRTAAGAPRERADRPRDYRQLFTMHG